MYHFGYDFFRYPWGINAQTTDNRKLSSLEYTCLYENDYIEGRTENAKTTTSAQIKLFYIFVSS